MKNRWCTVWLPMAIVFILLAWAGGVLLSRPAVGVADILDFWRVMRPAGIEHSAPLGPTHGPPGSAQSTLFTMS